jgi:hypothetical protein
VRPLVSSSQTMSWFSAAKGRCHMACSRVMPYLLTRAARQSCQAGRALRLLGRRPRLHRPRFA